MPPRRRVRAGGAAQMGRAVVGPGRLPGHCATCRRVSTRYCERRAAEPSRSTGTGATSRVSIRCCERRAAEPRGHRRNGHHVRCPVSIRCCERREACSGTRRRQSLPQRPLFLFAAARGVQRNVTDVRDDDGGPVVSIRCCERRAAELVRCRASSRSAGRFYSLLREACSGTTPSTPGGGQICQPCFYSLLREACSGTRVCVGRRNPSRQFLFAAARGVQRNVMADQQ